MQESNLTRDNQMQITPTITYIFGKAPSSYYP